MEGDSTFVQKEVQHNTKPEGTASWFFSELHPVNNPRQVRPEQTEPQSHDIPALQDILARICNSLAAKSKMHEPFSSSLPLIVKKQGQIPQLLKIDVRID